MAYKILIVDDERALCEMIRAFLAQAGYATATAGSCAEALTVFRAEQPDAVLLDVMLPDGDGFSLFGQLRALRDVPTLFLSARDEDAARLQGLGLGADDYITKPFLPEELLLRLAGKRQRPSRRCRDRLGQEPCAQGRRGNSADRQGIHPAAQALGQPRQHRHHRRPL